MKNHPTFVLYTYLCILNIKILIHNDILLLLASLMMSAPLGSVLDCFLFLAIIFHYDIYLVRLASGLYFWALQNLFFFLFNQPKIDHVLLVAEVFSLLSLPERGILKLFPYLQSTVGTSVTRMKTLLWSQIFLAPKAKSIHFQTLVFWQILIPVAFFL